VREGNKKNRFAMMKKKEHCNCPINICVDAYSCYKMGAQNVVLIYTEKRIIEYDMFRMALSKTDAHLTMLMHETDVPNIIFSHRLMV